MKNDVKVHYPNNEICSDYQNNDNINNKRDENEINEIFKSIFISRIQTKI